MSQVILMMGGDSAEREVSLQSGGEVLKALRNNGHQVTLCDPQQRDFSALINAGADDRVFLALHGKGGEDGCIQGFLNLLRRPYTGSGVLASALCMDKVRSKMLWQRAGLPTADFVHLTSAAISWQAIVDRLGLPLFVKPSREGSSFGVSRVERVDELPAAYELASRHDRDVVVERYLSGPEYTVGILGDQTLPAIRIETTEIFYNYAAKYLREDTRLQVPSGLSKGDEKFLGNLAFDIFRSVGGRGWGRVDFMADGAGKFHCLEVNTCPGMTSHSLVPTAAKAAGMSFAQVVEKILSQATCDGAVGT